MNLVAGLRATHFRLSHLHSLLSCINLICNYFAAHLGGVAHISAWMKSLSLVITTTPYMPSLSYVCDVYYQSTNQFNWTTERTKIVLSFERLFVCKRHRVATDYLSLPLRHARWPSLSPRFAHHHLAVPVCAFTRRVLWWCIRACTNPSSTSVTSARLFCIRCATVLTIQLAPTLVLPFSNLSYWPSPYHLRKEVSRWNFPLVV